MPSSGRGTVALVAVLALAVAAICGTALAGGLSTNPANNPKLLDTPIEDLKYDPATKCRSGTPPGTKALATWLDRNARGDFWGIYRCEKWGKHSASLHAESRAIDWRLDAGVPREKRGAMKLIHLLLEKDQNGEPYALARRMGVQGLIFNCRAWFGGGELGRYSHCYKDNGKRDPSVDRTTAHKDHIHIELNWAGARKKTSFWRGS